jgi:hypothetical protein
MERFGDDIEKNLVIGKMEMFGDFNKIFMFLLKFNIFHTI